jgi:hypothetical protein
MSEGALDTRAVVHRKVQPDDRAVGPADYCYSGDLEMVEKSDGITGEVVVVEGCEICLGGAAFAASTSNDQRDWLSFYFYVDWGCTLEESPDESQLACWFVL